MQARSFWLGGRPWPATTPTLLLLLPALLLLLTSASCGAEPVARQSGGGRTIMEHVDVPAVMRVMEARGAAAADADGNEVPSAADSDLAFGPPPSPSPKNRAAMAKLTPNRLKSSRGVRLFIKQKHRKQSWCKTGEMIRRLREPGCRTERIVDRFCHGQCNSFYIPRDGRRRRAFKSCPSCMPRRWERVTVKFKCPGQVPDQRERTVKLVKQCRCMARRRR